MPYLLRVEMVINSPWMLSKNWLVQKQTAFVKKQTALGKDTSNPLIVDSLLKTIWFSLHHHLTIEVLAIPGQTTTGCYLRNLVIEIAVLNFSSDALLITTNGIQLTMSNPVFNSPMIHLLRVEIVINSPWMLSKNWLVQKQMAFGDISRLQTLVDKKKIVISEVVIHEILQLDDAEGVVCFPNEEIFVGLAQMEYEKPSTKLTFYKAFFSSQWKFLIHTILQSLSAKRTSWNEFSTAMASAVICLSKGQKFNFSKYIFDSLVRNVDSSLKFYMYPRFIQLIIQNQVGDLSTHTTRFISPALTQKVFANMRRVGKGFSGVETPLFEENVAKDVSHNVIPSPPSHDIPSPSQEPSSPPQQPQSSPQAPPQGAKFPTQIQQVLNVCSALTRCVENLENDNAAQKLVIIKLKTRVKRLEKANMVKSSKLRRLRKVGASRRIESSNNIEDVFNQGRMIYDMDKDEGIELVKDADIVESEGRHATQQAKKQAEIYHIDLDHSSKVLSMQEDDSEVQEVVEVVTIAKLITDVVIAAASQVSAVSATISAAKPSIPAAAPTIVAPYIRRRKRVIIRDPEEELSSKTHAETPKVKDKGKGILVETPKPMKKKNQTELDAEYARKLHEEINRDHEEFNKDINWDAAMDHEAKRRKLSEEAQEAEDLKKCLEVVDDEDDDVFFEATPLARKVPVVDYQIVLVDNKPRFKIIKADETHQLYISFTTLLKNFNREDLESL
nr:hypothetical protein [Tanacetum cinerariifolium]